ncbi:MAG: hypothetical protein ACKVS8_08900 [Phycisphaerales bacterium]
MARPTPLASLTVAELQQEIRRRERHVGTLQRRRNRLARKLAQLDAEIALSGGSVVRTGRAGRGGATRARNKLPLADALAAALKGKRLSVGDAGEAVRKAGYHTTSPNFRTMVNIALLNKKRFKRIDRGVYTAV